MKRVKYIGEYVGESPVLHRVVHLGEIVEVSDEIAESLISSGQFKLIKPEVKKVGEMARNSG